MKCAQTWAGCGDRGPSINLLIVGFQKHIFVKWYITGRNCRLDRVLGVFNKFLGLLPSDTLSSCWLGGRRHARTGKQLFVKSCDLSFQNVTVFISTYVCLHWIKGIIPRDAVGQAAADLNITLSSLQVIICQICLRSMHLPHPHNTMWLFPEGRVISYMSKYELKYIHLHEFTWIEIYPFTWFEKRSVNINVFVSKWDFVNRLWLWEE